MTETLKALVVDDSSPVRSAIVAALNGSDIEVFEAANFAEAMKVSKTIDELNLLVSDYNMPGEDGLELVRQLREIRSDNFEVIMVTTETDVRLRNAAKDLGVKAWMIKPFSGKNIIHAVNVIFSRTEKITSV